MPAKPVQISMDTDLLKQVDADPETRKRGRSAFVCSAIAAYLKSRERQRIEAGIAKAYAGKGGELAAEISDLMGAQAWPSD